jgi:hypothetical protein
MSRFVSLTVGIGIILFANSANAQLSIEDQRVQDAFNLTSPFEGSNLSRQDYIQEYIEPGGCSTLPSPTFQSCTDAAISSGPGRSRQFLQQTNGTVDPVERAKEINQLHRQHLLNTPYPQFHRGFSNQKDRVDDYINEF